MLSTFQLAFDVDGAQGAQNGSYAPPELPDDRTHADRPCARCARLSASPTAPATGAICTSCRLEADRAERRCAICARPIPAGKAGRYCSRPCRDRADLARAAERDHAAGIPHARLRCQCDRPLLVPDDDLAETRCLRCGRPR